MYRILFSLLFTAISLPCFINAQTNYSLKFDGIDDYVIKNPNNLGSQFTYQCWVYPDPQLYLDYPDAGAAIFAQGASPGVSWADFAVGISRNGTAAYINVELGNPTQGLQRQLAPVILGAWTHISITFQSGLVKLYLNGNFTASHNFPISQANHSGFPAYFGSRYSTSRQYDRSPLQGNLDDIVLWSKALSETEIQTNYKCPPELNTIGLLGYWNLNEGINITANDLIFNNDGTLYNGTQWDANNPQSCLPDLDHDGVPDIYDNCPTTSNADQTDSDQDGYGDICDACSLDPFKTSPGKCGCGVIDSENQKPNITCPADIIYSIPDLSCGPVKSTVIILGNPTTSDNCGISTVSNNQPLKYQLGVTNVKWTVSDLNGNTNSCIQKITIKPVQCGHPIFVYHTDTTTNSATIKWSEGNPCNTGFQLRIRKQLMPGVWSSWSSWTNKSQTDGSHNFTNLESASFYHYQIRSRCGSAMTSEAVNGWFNTLNTSSGIKENSYKHHLSLYELNYTNDSTNIGVGFSNFQVFPNPTDGILYISVPNNEENYSVTIYNTSGHLLLSNQYYGIHRLIQINLKNSLSETGLYFLQVKSNRISQSNKFYFN
mgnify:CR=1 FL=1